VLVVVAVGTSCGTGGVIGVVATGSDRTVGLWLLLLLRLIVVVGIAVDDALCVTVAALLLLPCDGWG
jgi:hypothetical protein